MSRQVTFSI